MKLVIFVSLMLMTVVTLAKGQLDIEHHNHFDMVFKGADLNNNGLMTNDEFLNSFSVFDGNHDGTITKTEYMDYNRVTMPQHMSIVEPMFNYYDINKDGQLQTAELNQFYPTLDSDNDNVVSAKEWHNYWVKIFMPNMTEAPIIVG